MNLFAQGLLDSPLGLLLAGLIGLSFGFWLEKAGFGSSRRLAGIFYFRDFTVLQVMFSAIVTALLGLQTLSVLGLVDLTALYRMETVLGPQIAGGLVFGVGFVMGGWCPGTALVGLASGRLDALPFLLGAMLGSLGYAAVFPALGGFVDLGACGVSTLPESLGLSAGTMTLLLTGVALLLFFLVNRFGPRDPKAPAGDLASARST
ncbi:MAG: YeeE/YedE family protein [Planctomycetes bacterium]|nr:YeeE/YedE family protein [Planctomycetota bacterium]